MEKSHTDLKLDHRLPPLNDSFVIKNELTQKRKKKKMKNHFDLYDLLFMDKKKIV